jgi:hypothetical protein
MLLQHSLANMDHNEHFWVSFPFINIRGVLEVAQRSREHLLHHSLLVEMYVKITQLIPCANKIEHLELGRSIKLQIPNPYCVPARTIIAFSLPVYF